MKKLIALLAGLALTVGVSAPALAVTPTLKPPHIEIPSISVSVPKITFPDGYFDDIIKNIDWSKVNFGNR